jgi:flagellar protein FlgJ
MLPPVGAGADPAAVPPRLRKAAQDFEAQALASLLQPAFVTLEAGPFGGGSAEAQWRPMLVEAIAAGAVRAGQGLGLADTVLRELLHRQAAASLDPAQADAGRTTPGPDIQVPAAHTPDHAARERSRPEEKRRP